MMADCQKQHFERDLSIDVDLEFTQYLSLT